MGVIGISKEDVKFRCFTFYCLLSRQPNRLLPLSSVGPSPFFMFKVSSFPSGKFSCSFCIYFFIVVYEFNFHVAGLFNISDSHVVYTHEVMLDLCF